MEKYSVTLGSECFLIIVMNKNYSPIMRCGEGRGSGQARSLQSMKRSRDRSESIGATVTSLRFNFQRALHSMTDSNPKTITSREWILEAETEYRFELDPGAILAIKVRTLSR